jgi:signal peptidase
VRGAWRRFRRGTDRYRLFTDVVGAIIMVALIVGIVSAATGGVWPPVVIVESGSMMHAAQDTRYGRLGSIDVGDMVFVRAVHEPGQIETWADGGPLHYGRPGDVLAYAPNGDNSATPIIHRAIAFVEVTSSGPQGRTYALHWTDGKILTWGPQGIYFPPLGFSEDWGYSPNNGFRPAYSGFITKGDNAFSNPSTDQAIPSRDGPISALVEPTWILGEVHGEVPWIGLGKLTFQNQTNPEVPGWDRVGNAFAPLELWTMFFLTMALIVIVPLSLDTWRAYRRHKEERETTRRLEEENRRRITARKAAEAAARVPGGKHVTSFAAVVSARPLPKRP